MSNQKAPLPLPPAPVRYVLLVVTLVAGLLPGVFFFAWGHPALRAWLGVQGDPVSPGDPILGRVAFDLLLILAFGVVHSAAAQLPVRRRIAGLVGPRPVRALFMILTGFCLSVIMVTWRPVNLEVWRLVEPTGRFWIVDLAVYLAILHVATTALQGGRPKEFFGFRQLLDPSWTDEEEGREAGAATGERPVLRTAGAYAWVRHPGYALVLAAYLATPVMTLDRLTIMLGQLLYLGFGIPLEERKLVLLFGADYEAYRRRVPALVPRPWRT